ncbi:expressed unknown protein [Seminavis robusta]|uniref:TLC domain-containing protein n=1 Tax=Seminavis robusta TaxID=568900 RepID=A0A9N8H5G6_9STRA|nr:expressed unknown protein [Seminavis robusta]|eukprot:Sro74_g040630.1 n/a (323) ;mRNA; f:21373-22341
MLGSGIYTRQMYETKILSRPLDNNSSGSRLSSTSLRVSAAALPTTVSPLHGLKVAAAAGLLAATLQWLLSSALARRVIGRAGSPTASTKENAAYTAHSVVALILMLLLSGMGSLGWWFTHAPANKILDVSPTGGWMAAVVLGAFLLWDIPTSIRVKALRKPDVIIHHIVMMVLAGIATSILPMHYIFYYFGVVELSSVPLIIYDQVTFWIDTTNDDNGNTTGKVERLTRIQSILAPITALSFALVRVVSFTKVTVEGFLPDAKAALVAAANKSRIITPPQRIGIQFLMVACTLFTLLQWFWFSQIVQAFREQMASSQSSSPS